MPSVSKVLGDLASSTGSVSLAAGSNTAPAITTSGDTNTGIFFPAADTIAFAEGGVESMRIDSSGNVGIGTTSPTAKVQASATYATTWNTNDSTSAGYTPQTNELAIVNNQNATTNSWSGLFFQGGQASTNTQLHTARIACLNDGTTYGGTLAFATRDGSTGNSIERMRIDSSGNVGIGTTSPSTYSTKFGVKTAADQDSLAYFGGSSYATRIGVNSSFAVIEGVDAATGTSSYQPFCVRGSQLLFNTSGSERMRIDSSGQIFTNGNAGGTPAFTATSGTYCQLGNSSFPLAITSSSVVGIFNRNTSTGSVVEIKYNGNVKGSISTDGTNTAYNTSSDYRLKENIVNLSNALNTVSQLKPRQFDWKETKETTTGFIAHELQAVVPDCVTGEKDAVDEDGNPVYQGVDTSFLVATLTAAIQEQQTIINDLKARIETLEAN